MRTLCVILCYSCSSLVFVVCCAGSGLSDELTIHLKGSYRVCVCLSVCLTVFDLETLRNRQLGPEMVCRVTRIIILLTSF